MSRLDQGPDGKVLVAVREEGGAWSGKDFFKADRAGGMHARRLAKFVVGLARRI